MTAADIEIDGMQTDVAGEGRPSLRIAKRVAIAIAIVGALLMAAVASGLLYPIPGNFVGAHLYDLYAQALFFEGRWDLPMRDLKLEGHFTPDGTGYLYYGLAPLLTRVFFLPFVDLPTTWISAFSMWFWAVAGNAAYHRAFWLALAHGSGGSERIGGWASALLACAVWFASPGLLLVASGAVFDEPVVIAYAFVGGFVLVTAMAAFGRMSLERAILLMALLAGLTVHARQHLAVGLYVAVCLVALTLVLRGGLARWKSVIGAMAILGAFGLALIATNVERFGSASTVHGGFNDEDVQYASIFWGTESKDGPRAVAFTQFGQFNTGRILPNAIVYFASPPSNMGMDGALDAVERVHGELLTNGDNITNAEPRVGMVFLWPLWIVLMIVGLAQRSTWRTPPVAAGIAGMTIASLFMLSYMTITLRYHIDMWSLIALPAVFGLAAVARKSNTDQREAASWRSVLLVLATLGMFVTLHKTVHTRAVFGDTIEPLSKEFCLELAAKKNFSATRADEICSRSSEIKATI